MMQPGFNYRWVFKGLWLQSQSAVERKKKVWTLQQCLMHDIWTLLFRVMLSLLIRIITIYFCFHESVFLFWSSCFYFETNTQLQGEKTALSVKSKGDLIAKQGVLCSCFYCIVIMSLASSRGLVWISDWGPVHIDSAAPLLCFSSWSVGEWGGCSRGCGGGEQIRQVQCVQRISQVNADVLSDSQCSQPAPARRQACNTQSCPPVWTAGPWLQVRLDKKGADLNGGEFEVINTNV